MSFEAAKVRANSHNRRLPSAVEYEAILNAAANTNLHDASGRPVSLGDLFDDVAEWTTTMYDPEWRGNDSALAKLRTMHILKGYRDPTKLPGLSQALDGNLLAAPDTNSP